eukprot:PhM_4_TR16395/c0_g1_i1/m.88296
MPCTLFMKGFAGTVEPKHVAEMMMPFGGYVDCRIRVAGINHIVFVTFDTKERAVAVATALNGQYVRYNTADGEVESRIICEVARNQVEQADDSVLPSSHHHDADRPREKRDHGPYEYKYRKFRREVKKRSRDEEPATLYCNQLPSDVTEREMAHIFRHFEGFRGLRLHHNPHRRGVVSAFAEFRTRYIAEFAMACLTGYQFDENDKQGMGVEFTRKK